MEMMKRDNKEVAQDGVESTASQLQGDDWLAKWTKKRDHGTSKLREQNIQRRLIWTNSPDVEIHERIETNKSNKFSISGENKKEEESTSKGQEGSEIKTNSRRSNNKTKSGEYMLSRPPKKARGQEADEVDTTTTVSCVTASTCENRNKTISNRPEH